MNTLLLKTFLTIVEAGTISLAAEKLYTSQSTVSYRLKQLEQAIGVQLIYRNKGIQGISLTEYGVQFLGLVQNYLQLERKMGALGTFSQHHPLNIAGTQSFVNICLRPLFKRLLINKPELSLYVYTDHSSLVINKVVNLVADIGFVTYPLHHSSLVYKETLYEEFCLLCRKDSPYFDGISPQDLDPRYEIFFFWHAEFERWHNLTFGSDVPGMISLRTGGAMLFDMFNSAEVWSLTSASVADMIIQISEYDLIKYHVSPSPPAIPHYKILPTRYQQHPRGLAIFEEALDQFISDLKNSSEYYH